MRKLLCFALMVLFVAGCGGVSYETKSAKSVRRGRTTRIAVSKIQSSGTDCFTNSLKRKVGSTRGGSNYTLDSEKYERCLESQDAADD